MRFCIVGSGSKGNAVVVDGGGVRVLIDAGFAPRELRRRMAHLDIAPDHLDALVLTHAHGDHVKGAKQLAVNLKIPTYATDATKRFASTFTSLRHHVPITAGVPFAVGALTITPVKTVHDEPGSVAFLFQEDDGDERFAYCTDLGIATDSLIDGLKNANTIMLEFNHDRDMLKAGPYPRHLKERIDSRYGHLNNDDAAALLARLASPRLERVVCAHLSEVNNTEALAVRAARGAVRAGVMVNVAPQHSPTGWLRVRPRTRTAPASSLTTSLTAAKVQVAL